MTQPFSFLYYELGAGWCVAHLLLYVAVLRDRPNFYGERKIFSYHLGSACVYSLLALVPILLHPDVHSFTLAAGLIAAHGIYSISFLEVWSLAQGSYSISVLRGVQMQPGLSKDIVVERFAAIGEKKKSDRLTALLRLGLIYRAREAFALTVRGRCVATVFRLLRWLPNLQNIG